MNRFNVHTSSSMIRLSETLAKNLSAQPADPLAHETVVTLSAGMGRWLSMELAKKLGVCAGIDFRFPNDTIDSCFRAVIPDLPETSPYALDIMTWRIASLLPALLHLPAFVTIAAYLGDLRDDRRLLQLSSTLADTFDQYTIFRPEMILDWDKGNSTNWQAVLWRALTKDFPELHRAALLHRFRQNLAAVQPLFTDLPSRITLFGISFLPPFHLEVFSLLSRLINVDIYLLNPCGCYWGDLLSVKKKAHLALNPTLPTEALEFYETGNQLLSSLGTQGQDFFNLLLDFDANWYDADNGHKPEQFTILGIIQSDIMELRERGDSIPRASVEAHDYSLQIHSCHGPLREMEVLYDNLLSMFDQIPGLEPRSIVVMTPDIETYAPYISAVFGTRCGGRPAIPYTIADRSARSENPLIEPFLRILGLSSSRFGLNGILEILECPQIMARFDVTPDELELIRLWLREAGIRWGLDEHHRVELGFSPYADFSWQAGLERLFLGYAMAPAGDTSFSGILPCDNIEGRLALPLGKLALFINTAARVKIKLAAHQTLREWSETLTTVADQLICPLDDNDTGCSSLYSSLLALRETQQQSGFDQRIGIDAIKDHLTGLLGKSGGTSGFLNGRVTFCAMLPMRSIPQRVICLVGMNDGTFPRTPRQPHFNLMNGARRRGDRSVRDEDRYLFLEAIMSASERLYISYNGQNDRDNSLMPPSVVVSELLDYVQQGFVQRGSIDTAPDVVIRHRLQSFNRDYFSENAHSKLFSYAVETRDALDLAKPADRAGRIFITSPLPDDPTLSQQLEIGQLIKFLGSPAKSFLSMRMNVHPYDPEEEIDEREPFAIDSLTGYGLRQNLVSAELGHIETGPLYAAARARSLLPPLRAGKIAFDSILQDSSAFAAVVTPHLGESLDKPLQFSLDINGTSLTGTIPDLRMGRHVRWRCAGMKAKDRLSLWVEHLILNTVRPEGYPRESLLICKDLTLELPELENAAELLADLVALFREGLCRPLHFFPQAAWLFLEKDIDAAESRWHGTDYSLSPAESAQPAFSLCFDGQNALNDEFIQLANRVYGPFRKLSIEERLK